MKFMKFMLFIFLITFVASCNGRRVCKLINPQSVCPRGEVESPCNGRCQPTYAKSNPTCTRICARGCVCPSGQLRNLAGKCILKAKCPAASTTVAPGKCEANEVWANCVQSCSACKFFTNRRIACSPVPPQFCKPGCACVAGYRKDDRNKCLPENECGPPQ